MAACGMLANSLLDMGFPLQEKPVSSHAIRKGQQRYYSLLPLAKIGAKPEAYFLVFFASFCLLCFEVFFGLLSPMMLLLLRTCVGSRRSRMSVSRNYSMMCKQSLLRAYTWK
jgi:hypothetical protein